MTEIPHIPVLYREVINTFKHIKNGIIIDCTLGYGGHSSLILESNPNINIIGIDQDKTAIEFSKKRFAKYKDRIEIKKGRFSSTIKDILKENNTLNIKGILADIGVSSLQLDQKIRGFSYESNNLDMRMDTDANLRASDVVNNYSQTQLENILLKYGELKNYKNIASKIIKNRPFNSAKELSLALKSYMPQGKKIHPSTLLMQAIRIEVNDELGELQSLLLTLENSKFKSTKIAIISFHSLEDRIIKQEFIRWKKSCICRVDALRCTCGNNHSLGKIITKKPIMASEQELKENRRSRSAKMRIFNLLNEKENV